MYVADWGNERVQVLDPDGNFVITLRGEATMFPWGQQFMDANQDEAGLRQQSDLRTADNIRRDSEHELSSHIEHLFWGRFRPSSTGPGTSTSRTEIATASRSTRGRKGRNGVAVETCNTGSSRGSRGQ